MHFASHLLVGESMEKPFMYLGDNVINGLNLLETMVDHGVRRFILSSTANLFDQPERIPIDEGEQIVPGSPYGESKFILERMLHWLDQIHGLRYAALRYFNAAGATAERGEDHSPETHLIPLVLQVALGQREQIQIYGNDYPTRDGTCVRDYIHVLDLAQAHILALRALDDGSRTYNLGNGQGYTVREVIEMAREVTGHPIPAVDRSPATRRSARAGRQLGQDPAGAGLAAPLPRPARHRPERLGLAPGASQGLHQAFHPGVACMRIAINAWFLDQPGTGSGQYLHGLLRAMPGVGPEHQFLLVAPPGVPERQIPGLQVEFWPIEAERWRSRLGKVLFEQVAFPRACRRGERTWPTSPTGARPYGQRFPRWSRSMT